MPLERRTRLASHVGDGLERARLVQLLYYPVMKKTLVVAQLVRKRGRWPRRELGERGKKE